MPEPIPLRPRSVRTSRTRIAAAAPTKGLGSARGIAPVRVLGSPRPPAYRPAGITPLRWHARWPRPHPLAWAVFGCVAFWWTVICAVRF